MYGLPPIADVFGNGRTESTVGAREGAPAVWVVTDP
jgi:hypothetical protein